MNRRQGVIQAINSQDQKFLGQHEAFPDWALWDYSDMEDSLFDLLRDELNVEKQEKFIYVSTAARRG